METLDAIIGFQKWYDDMCIHFNIPIYLFVHNIMVYSIGHIKEMSYIYRYIDSNTERVYVWQFSAAIR